MDTSSGTAHTTRRDDPRRLVDTYPLALAGARLDILSDIGTVADREAVSDL
jgi:hypothetical protein